VWAKLISKLMLTLVIITHIFQVCVVLTACIPIEKFWNPLLQGYCHDQNFWWAVTGINIASDFLIFLIPLPVIFTMTIPLRQKFGLYIVFLVGFLYDCQSNPFKRPDSADIYASVCLVSALRLMYMLSLYNSEDTTWDNVPIAIWTCVEVNVAIVCACLMTIKPLIVKLLPKIFLERNVRGFERQGSGERSPRQLTIGSKPVQLRDGGNLLRTTDSQINK
jgi:hypothetical protein